MEDSEIIVLEECDPSCLSSSKILWLSKIGQVLVIGIDVDPQAVS